VSCGPEAGGEVATCKSTGSDGGTFFISTHSSTSNSILAVGMMLEFINNSMKRN